MENNFERLRALVEEHNPDQLSRFDAFVHKMKSFDQDDEILMLLEATGFLSLAYSHNMQDATETVAELKKIAEDMQALPSHIKGRTEAKLSEILNDFDTEAKMSVEYLKKETEAIEAAKEKAEDAVKTFEQIKSMYLAKLGVAFIFSGIVLGAGITYLLMQ